MKKGLILIVLVICSKFTYCQVLSDKEYLDIIQYCSQILKKDSNNVECLDGRTTAYYMLNNNDSAIVDYLNLLRINPESKDAIYNLGIAYYQSGNYQSSILLFEKCITKKIYESLANFYMANSYLGLEQYGDARKYYLKSLKLDNELQLTSFANIGLSYMLEKNYEKAILYFDKALILDSIKINCLYYRGFSYLNLNNFEKSEIDLRKTLRIDPSNTYGNMFYSILLCKNGRKEESVKYLKIVKETGPEVFKYYQSYYECN